MIDDINFNRLRSYSIDLIKIQKYGSDRKKNLNASFPYIDSRKKDEMAKIYTDVTGGGACSTCDKEWLVRLSRLYFEKRDSLSKCN